MEEKKERFNTEELIKKYGIDIENLKKEQIKVSKDLEIKDKIDFSLVDRFGAVDNTFINNKLLSCIIVCNKDYEVIDRAYVFEKVKFPYIPGFRNYRELAPMINAFEKLNERPDVIFVPAEGIMHPRLGLSSHYSLSTGIPTIGISNSLIDCETEGDNVLKNGKKVGKILVSKEKSNPMYISPGNSISVDSTLKVTNSLIKPPHKLPEPMNLAGKYSKSIRKELEI